MKTLKKTEYRTAGAALVTDILLCVALSPIFADDSDTDDIPAVGSYSESDNTSPRLVPAATGALIARIISHTTYPNRRE